MPLLLFSFRRGRLRRGTVTNVTQNLVLDGEFRRSGDGHASSVSITPPRLEIVWAQAHTLA